MSLFRLPRDRSPGSDAGEGKPEHPIRQYRVFIKQRIATAVLETLAELRWWSSNEV